jgi:trehalose synthase
MQMLKQVSVSKKSLDAYRPIVGEGKIEEIRSLAGPLKGARVVHINATAFGGGVAEILYTLVPLMRDVGLDAEWQVIEGTDRFFRVTKAMHNALHGADVEITSAMQDVYLHRNEANSNSFEGDYDFVVVHDSQPAALLQYHGRGGGKHWIWRCHIDTSTPNEATWKFIRPYLELYDVRIFHKQEYAGDLALSPMVVMPPSIDPLSPKNSPMSMDESKVIMARFGIDVDRPLLTQVSRFDPWKDPLGVIDAYRMVKEQVPEVQLALIASMASDDPEGWIFYDRIVRHAGEDFDIHVLHNFHGVGNVEVNAFQSGSDVIIQKSIREGFGLVVSEAMWKGKPVIGGNVGGIPLQIIDKQNGFLVDSVEECAGAALSLLQQAGVAQEMGVKAREYVRENFLSTRHLRDYLGLFLSLT